MSGRHTGRTGLGFRLGRALCVAVVFTLTVTAVPAQQAGRIRGQIEQADGAALSLKTRDGQTVSVKLADDVRVAALVKASLADLKPDTFIGVAGVPLPDGSIGAYSIHIFLPAQRGVVPDRHGAWDGRPNSTMTNAYVGTVVRDKDGEAVTVKYKDGEKKVLISPETVIAAVAPGTKDELKPGTGIVIMASERNADGSVLARSIYLGRDVAPAM